MKEVQEKLDKYYFRKGYEKEISNIVGVNNINNVDPKFVIAIKNLKLKVDDDVSNLTEIKRAMIYSMSKIDEYILGNVTFGVFIKKYIGSVTVTPENLVELRYNLSNIVSSIDDYFYKMKKSKYKDYIDQIGTF